MYLKTVIDNHGQLDYIDNLFDNPDYVPDGTERKCIRTKTYLVSPDDRLPGLSFEEQATVSRCINYMLSIKSFIERFTRENNPEEFYYEFKIPKRTSGFRTIDAPKTELKQVQYQVLDMLKRMKILPHDAAWAYVKGRDIKGAILEHKKNNSRWFLKLDLTDFFGSCNKECVYNMLRKLYPLCYVSEEVYNEFIDALFSIASKDGKLPQGTPLSPYLTNLIMVSIDYEITRILNNLAKENEIKKQRYVYTRYADDMLISAKEHFNYSWLLAFINNSVLKSTPFRIKEEKTRYGSSAGRNWNLGLMYNKDLEITVGYKKKKRIKVAIHNFMTSPDTWSLEDLQVLLGQLSWIKQIEPEYFTGLMGHFQSKHNHINPWNLIVAKIKELTSD